MKFLKKRRFIVLSLAVPTIAVLLIIARVQDISPGSIVRMPEPPDQHLISEAAMVLGASVNDDGTPSDALRDRLDVGIELYKNQNADKILLTGDDGAYHQDEIDTMKTYVEQKGVPEKDIFVDGHGYRTYESCKRAANVFHLHNIIVVTQRFHMARAQYLCVNFGLSPTGVFADRHAYRDIAYFWARDLLASVKAWWDVNIWPPNSPVQ